MCCNQLNRRDFFGVTTGILAGVALSRYAMAAAGSETAWTKDLWDPDKPFAVVGKPLRVQPILMYAVSQRREAASWKSWGGVQTEAAADEEAARITTELAALAGGAGFAVEFLPVAKVTTTEAAEQVHATDYDVALVYPATGSGGLLRACFSKDRNTLVFLRHRSGPVYYWYEALSVKYLNLGEEKAAEVADAARCIGVDDVVVDDSQELLWRLRALYAVKNFLGAKIVALGGVSGKYAPKAPEKAREQYALEIVEVAYNDFAPRIEAALKDTQKVALARDWTERYLALPNTTLQTDKEFVVNCFLLYGLFKELVRECGAAAFTIQDCMATIMPMSKTTACLTLSLLNDEGLPTFCESDFVIIPTGILLYYITGKPVFLHNSTFPHGGMVTCAHCTAPRRMDGARYEPALIVTHYESEYGAAPKIEMPIGQTVTCIDPEYDTGRWLGFTGAVKDNPFYEICRSQQDVEIHGDWKKLLREVRDSHWIMAYGDHLKEMGYAARKIGVRWEGLA